MPPSRGNLSWDEDRREALIFLGQVKKVLKYEEEKYHVLLNILGNYKVGGITIDVVKTQVLELFEDRQELILGFSAFLPEGSEVITTDDTVTNPSKTTEFPGFRSFLNKFKEHFPDDDNVYKYFMGILNDYMIEHKDITKFQNEVGALLEGHLDLVKEFTRITARSATTSTTKTLSAKEADLKLFSSVLSEIDENRINRYP